MTKTKLNVAIIGGGFMGRTHSNGYHQAKTFFDLPLEPVKKVVCDSELENAQRLAARFGWEETAADWREVIARPDIDLIDICTPVHTHAAIALAAVKAGKAVYCEKPLTATLAEAREVVAAVKTTGVPNMCSFITRAAPAVTLARQMVEEGLIGQIFEWRSTFLQAWLVDPAFPLTWRLRKETAGSGALSDLGSHSLDLARWLVGEVAAVSGQLHTYTKERSIPVKDIGRNSIPSGKMGAVTVDDVAWATLRFENGAFGSMEASRMATGRLCAHRFEIHGSKGALAYDFMRLNELEYFNNEEPRRLQGWRTIHATLPVHPYMSAWWPAGHSIGYEHSFTHLISNFIQNIAAGKPTTPNFEDSARVQAIMEAVERSNESRAWAEVEAL